MSKKVVNQSGTRKRAIARASLHAGNSKIMINKVDINQFGNELSRARIMEPLILAGEAAKKYDVRVRVSGGGSTSQADAIRLAIARALAQEHEKLRQTYLDYDRTLLVADIRRKEPAKPNSHGQARAKRQKSYR